MENVWFSVNFDNFVNDISVLPYDHHSLAALVAPRALISFENTDFEWCHKRERTPTTPHTEDRNLRRRALAQETEGTISDNSEIAHVAGLVPSSQ